MSTVLLRVDDGPRIGLGHLQRSLALADALQELGLACLFLLNHDSAGRERVEERGFAAANLSRGEPWSRADLQAVREMAAANGCDAVIVDSHRAGPGYASELGGSGLYSVWRDDLAGFPFPCHLVVNGNAGAERLPYVSSSGDTRFLLGTEYMVLGREFWDWRPRDGGRPVQNVLVTLGGTDEHNLMPRLLKSMDWMPGGFKVTAVIGPYFKDVHRVEEAASQMTREVRLARSPASLRCEIQQADLAVSAAGQTLYELARAGCPTVAFSVAANQRGQLATLEEAGFPRSAGDAAKDDVVALAQDAVSALVQDSGARSAMARAGRRLVDGKGALRVAQRILTESCAARAHTKGTRVEKAFSGKREDMSLGS